MVAYEAIKRIGAIYHLDNQLADLKPDERRERRQINLKPLVEAFFAWAKEIQTSGRLSKGKTLEGLNYCINQEKALKVFTAKSRLIITQRKGRCAASVCTNMHGS